MAVGERELRITISSIFNGDAFKRAGEAAKNLGEQVETTFERMEERAEHTQSVFKGLVEAFIGVEIVEALKKIAEGASDASDSLEIAANTAKNFGKSFSADEMEQWLQKLAASAQGGGYAITDLRNATQQLATTGASAAQIQRLLVDAVALAATKHIELAEATHLVVEAATGHVEVLGRYGIVVKDAADRTLTFAQVMANLEAETMGNAEKRAESLEGAFGRLATAANDLVSGPFGQTMEHIFIAGANAATALLSAIAALPAPVLDVAAAGVALVAGLTALGVMLPATKLAFEFLADGILMARDLLVLFGNVVMAVIPELAALRDALMSVEAVALVLESPLLAIGAAIAVVVAGVVEATRGFKDLKAIWSWFLTTGVGQTLFPKIPEIKAPKASLTGLGGIDPNQQKAIDDWLAGQKAAILRAVEVAQEVTDEAQARLEDATARLQELRDKRDPTKPLTKGNVAEEQQLANDELAKERDLRAAIADQRAAEVTAARQLNALANALPGNDKDRVTQAVALREEAEKHVLAAIKLDATYDKMGGTIAKLLQEILKIPRALQEQGAALAKIAADYMQSSLGLGFQGREYDARSAFERSQVRPANGPNEAAQRRVAGAQFDYTEATNNAAQAAANEQAAEAARALADLQAAKQDAVTAAKTRADADLAVEAASVKLANAQDDLALATAKLTEAKQEERNEALKTIEQKTLGQIPGVSVGATGNLGFSPASFLADAISQSHLFANVMELVNEIMFTFTQIINAFQPVVDALLTVVAYVVNGFISLWNVIAKLVSILGIQLQQLSYINTVFTATGTNLVTFTHDIPTLNELATGNIAPLTTTPSNNPWSILHQDLVTNDQHQQNWFSSVINALGALLLIDWLTHGKFLTSIQGLLPQFGSFFSGIGTAFENGWNGLQSWLTAHLGNVGAGIADIVGGTALLFTSDKGVLGVLEKVLGVLLIIQGLMNASGSGGSIINTIANALGLGGGSQPVGYQNGIPVFNGATVNVPIDPTQLDPSLVGDEITEPGLSNLTGSVPDIGSLLGGSGAGLGGGAGAITDPVVDDLVGGAGAANTGLTTIGTTSTTVNTSLNNLNNAANATGGALNNLSKIGLNLGAGLAGGLLGSFINNALGGNSQNSQIGSTILGAVGSIFGPLGTGLGSLVGSVIGGLFGPHYNQQNNPDMYANDGYAQAEANYQGSSNTQANGYVSEDPTLSNALGGLSESQFLSQFIAQNPQLAAQLLTPTEVSEFSGNDAVENLHQGTLTLGNGQSANWSDLFNNVNDAMQKITNYVQSATTNNNTSTASTASNANIQITNQVSIGSVDGYNDIEQLGTDLANVQIRTIQSRLYLNGRATAVA